MANRYRSEKYSFRVISSSKSNAELLAEAFSKLGFEVSIWPYFRNKRKQVISFEFSKNLPTKGIESVLFRNQIKEEDYGFFLALNTDRDMDGLSIPQYICKLHKQIGGQLDFSFIFINKSI